MLVDLLSLKTLSSKCLNDNEDVELASEESMFQLRERNVHGVRQLEGDGGEVVFVSPGPLEQVVEGMNCASSELLFLVVICRQHVHLTNQLQIQQILSFQQIMADQQVVVDEKENVLKRALAYSDNRSLLVKGLHQVCKKIMNEKERPKFVILAQNNADQQYKKIVLALCKTHKVPYMLIKEAQQLGEWLGFCKRDINKTIRKKVKCGSVALIDFAPQIKDEDKNHILEMMTK